MSATGSHILQTLLNLPKIILYSDLLRSNTLKIGHRMYKIYFYVPETHLESVKSAIFSCGAGKVGNYDCCAWQTLGTGQFRALDGSHPAIGQHNQLEKVFEYKVETVCEDIFLPQVLSAFIKAHPYENPAYGYYKVTADGDASFN